MARFKPIQIVRNRAALRRATDALRTDGKTIGFVPTMGALHDGHLSLVKTGLAKADHVIASIFVNPTQFAPGEDFDAYPRNEEVDLKKLESAGCEIVYMPTAEEMYPDGSLTNVRVEIMSDLLDGIYRPHFFYGVATVVARLFIHVQPDVAVFGEKDYQQLQIIRRMVRDLGFVIDVVGAPTVRDPDGLAQSSRNAYLSTEQRREAGALFAALHRAGRRIEAGCAPEAALTEARAHILASGFDKLDYVELVDPETLKPSSDGSAGPARLLGAAWMGKTRLIDNLACERPPR